MMKTIKYKDWNGLMVELEVGKRTTELGDVLSDIILDGDTFILQYGSQFFVYKGIPFEYMEMHATKNPHQFKGRDKNI